jgi:uncharacterized protein (TIGR04551 family)
MPRLPKALALALAGLALCLALAGAASAQEAKAPAAAPEADPRVQAAIQKAVDKAKEDLRNEMRAELQGAQSAAEFMGTVADQPKLQLLDLDGYFRFRWQNLSNLNLRNKTDAAGWYDFPRSLHGGNTFTTANMRLRLEPTINASEMVRVRMQVDVLDNYVLGSNVSQVADGAGSPYPVPFYGDTRTYTTSDNNTNDRPLIIPRRVWGEVQTPVGLLSFGRMPSSWGLGLMANAGTGLDQDFGDTVDRIQFALPPVSTPLGDLVFVPILDYDLAGAQLADPHGGQGTGQPLDADGKDSGRTYALKIARLDTDEELRRKQERGERSLNYGLYYNYRTQSYVYPAWLDQGYCGYLPSSCNATGQNQYQDPSTGQPIYNRRAASGHYTSLWLRWLGPKFRVEGELVGMYGSVGNANAGVPSGSANSGSVSSTAPAHISMRQWGYVLQTEFKQSSKFSWGVELGAASGDSAPGMGNLPNRGTNVDGVSDLSVLPNYGSLEGPQWGRPGDRNIDNFRFNPAYQVDLILYRRILGQVTDSWYLRPNLRWDIIPGLTLDTSALYAQAIFSQSTPSSSSVNSNETNSPLSRKGARPLGIELDNKLTLAPTTGFVGWVDLGFLQPLAGFGGGTSMAWVLEVGLAARF